MDYDKAYRELDQILTTTNNINHSLDKDAINRDIISVNGVPFVIANTGEAFRGHLREQIAWAMEDYGLTAQEATVRVVAEIKALDDMGWWKFNAWFIEFA